MVENLSQLVLEGLEEATVALCNQSSTSNDGKKLAEEKSAVVDRFSTNVSINFDVLTGDADKTVNTLDYGSLNEPGRGG